MKQFGWFCLVVFICITLSLIGKVLWLGNVVENSARGVVATTLNSSNVLQNYEYFKQTAQDYNGALAQVAATKSQLREIKQTPRKEMDWEDKKALNQLETTLSGQVQYVNQLASDYNAKSQMQNRSLFKTKDLPVTLQRISR